MTVRQPLRGVAWMVVAQALFAIMALGGRLSGRELPWQEVAGSRFLVGALTALAVARLRGSSLRVTRKREAWIRSGFGTLAAAGTFYVLAAPGLAIGDAVTLFATSPIFVALFSWPLLGEPVRRNVGIAIALAFAGIIAVARPSFQTSGHLVVAGALVALCSGLAMIWLRRIGPSETSEAIVLHFSTIGFVVMLLLSIPVWKTPDAHGGALLLVTGFSGGLGQLAMTRAYSLDHAARVSAVQYTGVVITRLLAFPVFGEVPTAVQVAGSLLVILAGVILALPRRA
jgi:drug/metabolite transporter (DMT)-like permease